MSASIIYTSHSTNICICIYNVVSFPRPYSRLLDIRVIIGDNSHLSALMSGLEREMSKDNIIKWSKLTWFYDEW